MKQLVTFGIVLLCVCVTGCSARRGDGLPTGAEALERDAQFSSVMHADRFKKSYSWPMYDSFRGLLYFSGSAVGVTEPQQRDYYTRLITVLSSPVVELPEFWVSIINNEELDSGIRVHAMQSLFMRHVQVGGRLDKLSSFPGSAKWFTEDNVTPIRGGGGGMILPKDGDDVLVCFDWPCPGLMDRSCVSV